MTTIDRDILEGEAVQAWRHGPVIPSIYHETKHYGPRNIDSLVSEMVFDEGVEFDSSDQFEKVTPRINEDDIDLNRACDFVWESYGDKDGWYLVNLTHQEGSPWSQVYEKNKLNIVIPNSIIKEQYIKLVTLND